MEKTTLIFRYTLFWVKEVICIMKKAGIYIILFAIFIIIGYNAWYQREVKPDTPHNVSWLMKLSLDENNYNAFNDFFIEGLRGEISQEEFEKMSDISTAGWEERSYHLIEFTNNEMLLVYLTPNKINGKYYIQDIKIVPDELREFFKHD